MTDRTNSIFGNRMKPSVVRKAVRSKKGFIREFGDDSGKSWHLGVREIPALAALGVSELMVTERGDGFKAAEIAEDPMALVVGNIRMGFGHYRISMAIASAARSWGLNPYWFDLHAFKETSGGKIISRQNSLYSMGSRLSQKSAIFNRLVWDPLNSQGFRKLSCNAVDQKVAEIMASPCALLPKDVPYIATHAWPAQAAVHAGLSRVVNIIPDNWPLALHLSEGAIHCVQSPSAWQGYKLLRGMSAEKPVNPMPRGSIRYTGHYIDHEIVSNLEADTGKRIERLYRGKALRILMTIGGAGAQKELFAAIIRYLLPSVRKGKVCLFVNVGDHRAVMDSLRDEITELASATIHSGDWDESSAFATAALEGDVSGIHFFHDPDIFAAVYVTNLLMRSSDLLVTKPSELAYYPVPKLHIKRVGGHEAWGAIRSAELGDGSVECVTVQETLAMLTLLIEDSEGLELMNRSILAANRAGVYNGAYRAVEIALGKNEARERNQ